MITSSSCDPDWKERVENRIVDDGLDAELIVIDSRDPHIEMYAVLAKLKDLGIEKVLVEGGTSIISQFVEGSLFDSFTIYYGPYIIGGDGPSLFDTASVIDRPIEFRIASAERLGEGILVEIVCK